MTFHSAEDFAMKQQKLITLPLSVVLINVQQAYIIQLVSSHTVYKGTVYFFTNLY